MNIKLTLPPGEAVVTGKQVTFVTPCDSKDLEAVIINEVPFTVVDSSDKPAKEGAFVKDAIVSVILYVEKSFAYLQNTTIHLKKENWVFTLEDGSTVTKVVYVE